MKTNRIQKSFLWTGLFLLAVIFPSCSSEEKFTTEANTEFFIQNYNPEYVDILWMLDERSPMNNYAAGLTEQASQFFMRLDQATSQYRMGVVSADMQYAQGRLKLNNQPIVIQKNTGTLQSRTQIFKTLLGKLINLNTSAQGKGIQSVVTSLARYFIPRNNVPLVLVFVTDTDDHSDAAPGGQNTLDYYEQLLVNIKGGKRDLIKVYSMDYMPLNGAARTTANRCATFYNAEIDVLGAAYEDRYFKLADRFGGVKTDLCKPFASLIDLSGLRLQALPRVFHLTDTPRPDSIQVVVALNGQDVTGPWFYDVSENMIVFQEAPPEGSTIQVTFVKAGK